MSTTRRTLPNVTVEQDMTVVGTSNLAQTLVSTNNGPMSVTGSNPLNVNLTGTNGALSLNAASASMVTTSSGALTLSATDGSSNVVLDGAAIDASSKAIVNVATPTGLDMTAAANVAYTLTFADGLVVKTPALAATTAAFPSATYNNGTSGVGATLTNSGAQVALAIDGVAMSVTDRVLVKDEGDPATNGLYTVTDAGSVATNWELTRATDFDDASEIPKASFLVTSGTVNESRTFVCTTPVSPPIVIGTTGLGFALFSQPIVITVDEGLVKTGNQIDVVSTGGTLALTPGNAEVNEAHNFTFTGAATGFSNAGGTFTLSQDTVDVDAKTLQMDATTAANLTLTTSTASTETLTVQASNAGAGIGEVKLVADQVNLDTTASGTILIDTNGGTITGTSTTYTMNVTETSEVKMTANNAANQTLTIEATNSGAGDGILDVNADQLSLDGTVHTELKLTANQAGAATLNITSANAGAGTGLLAILADDTLSVTSTNAAVTVDGASFSVDGTTSSNLSMTANTAGTETLTIAGTNAGAGTGVVDVDADDLQLGGTESAELKLVANQAGAATLTVSATNAGAGDGKIAVSADDDIDVTSTGGNVSVDAVESSNFTVTANNGADQALTLAATNAGAGDGNISMTFDNLIKPYGQEVYATLQTSDATPTIIHSFTTNTDRAYCFTMTASMNAAANAQGRFTVQCFKNAAGTAQLVGTAITIPFQQAAPTWTLFFGVNGTDVELTATGQGGTTVDWRVRILIVETA